MSKNIFINEERPHDSASKHVSGHAIYTDDIKEPYGTLHGAIGCSKKAQKNLEKDFSPINDTRATKDYRMEVAKNLLMKCFIEIKKNKLIRLN